MDLAILLIAIFFAIVIAIVSWMVHLSLQLRNRDGTAIPVFYRFPDEVLPILLLGWSAIVVLFIIFRWPWLWVVGVWASITTIMLWPCARGLGLRYFEYRRPFFILGVLSMAALPALGFLLDELPRNATRTWALLATVAVLTVFSILAGLKRAVGDPPHMLFRPDVLFGDGRVLATGIISLGLSMRFLFGGDTLPIPKGNWYGLLLAITFGIIQIIPLRGMLKLRMRMARMVEQRFGGWSWVFLREAYLLVAAFFILYGFHNVLMGLRPFVDFSLHGLSPEHFNSMGKPGLILMAVSAFVFVVGRGIYKKKIVGDPFVRERTSHAVVKSLLILGSILPFFYGLAHVMEAHGGPFPRPFPSDPQMLGIGLALLIWGALMETVFRIIVQQVQQRAIVEQMAAVILPRLSEEQRKTVMQNVMSSLTTIEEKRRRAFIRSMLLGVERLSEGDRQVVARTRSQVMADLPETERQTLMKSTDAVQLQALRA